MSPSTCATGSGHSVCKLKHVWKSHVLKCCTVYNGFTDRGSLASNCAASATRTQLSVHLDWSLVCLCVPALANFGDVSIHRCKMFVVRATASAFGHLKLSSHPGTKWGCVDRTSIFLDH